jgi:hypothetical protein
MLKSPFLCFSAVPRLRSALLHLASSILRSNVQTLLLSQRESHVPTFPPSTFNSCPERSRRVQLTTFDPRKGNSKNQLRNKCHPPFFCRKWRSRSSKKAELNAICLELFWNNSPPHTTPIPYSPNSRPSLSSTVSGPIIGVQSSTLSILPIFHPSTLPFADLNKQSEIKNRQSKILSVIILFSDSAVQSAP